MRISYIIGILNANKRRYCKCYPPANCLTDTPPNPTQPLLKEVKQLNVSCCCYLSNIPRQLQPTTFQLRRLGVAGVAREWQRGERLKSATPLVYIEMKQID